MGRVSEGSHGAKKGVYGSPGLVDFANGLVNSVLKLREVFFFWGGGGNSNYRKTVINCAHKKKKKIKMTLVLVHAI